MTEQERQTQELMQLRGKVAGIEQVLGRIAVQIELLTVAMTRAANASERVAVQAEHDAAYSAAAQEPTDAR